MLFLVAMAVSLSAQMTEISGDRMRAHVKFLSSDLLEGRGVGARGGELASDYIATQFALIGAKPLGDNERISRKCRSWASNRRLPRSSPLRRRGAISSGFHWLEEFVGVTMQQKTGCHFRRAGGLRGPRHRRAGISMGRLSAALTFAEMWW